MTATGGVHAEARPVLDTIAELLAGATEREPMKTADSKSSSPFERVVIGGERRVVKYLSWDTDWISRATGDTECRALQLWRTGGLDRLPTDFDHAIVAVAHEAGTTALLMRDVGEHLVPEGNSTVSLAQHHRFLAHMAHLHAAMWDSPDPLELTPVRSRYSALSEATGRNEVALGHNDEVPSMLVACWETMRAAAGEAGRLATDLAADPTPLVDALATTPQSFIHGDWKFGNLGSHPDGRTILLDWQWPGRAAPLTDLAWYLAVNCDRLPESKEDAIEFYRQSLEASGIDTEGWWDRQLALCLLGAFVQLGWSKPANPAELGWWAEKALAAAPLLR